MSVEMQTTRVLGEKHYTWSDYEPIGRTAQPQQRNHSLQQRNVDRRHHGRQPLEYSHLSSPPSFKLLVEPSTEPFVHLMHNNCQRVHLLLAQSHLSRHFMRIPPPTQIISVVTAFCGFHISPRHFSGGTTTQLCVVLVSSHSTLPAVLTLSYLSRLPMVLVVPGSCLLEVRQFVLRDGSSPLRTSPG